MFINFCQIKTLEYSEQLLIDAYNIIQPTLDSNIDKAFKADQYGLSGKAITYWDDAADLRYLILYMFIIRMRILRDYQNCDLQSYQTYIDDFELVCIRKHFTCKIIPFNINSLFDLFGIGVNSFSFDGIGFDALEVDDSPVCNNDSIFEVQPNNP